MLSRAVSKLLLGIALCALAFGVFHLFELRSSTGDSFPAYSSLRADPLGCKALYESLSALPELTVERNYREEPKLSAPAQTTVFLFGTGSHAVDFGMTGNRREIDTLAINGSRVILAFLPVQERDHHDFVPVRTNATVKPSTNTAPSGKKGIVKKPKPQTPEKKTTLKDDWGLSFEYFTPTNAAPKDADTPLSLQASCKTNLNLPDSISWHSVLYFQTNHGGWRVIYTCNNKPVVIERSVGKGSIVLASDSFFASNEALRMERHPTLLAWLVGPNTHVVFDETHLGMQDEPGLATMLRQYGLGSVIGVLLLLAALYIWKNASALTPAQSTESSSDAPIIVEGRDAASGVINLLRRNIPPHDILSVCVAEWKRSQPQSALAKNPKLPRIEAVVQAEADATILSRNPVEAYRKICGIIAEKGKPQSTTTPLPSIPVGDDVRSLKLPQDETRDSSRRLLPPDEGDTKTHL